jgi:hypothetical protein
MQEKPLAAQLHTADNLDASAFAVARNYSEHRAARPQAAPGPRPQTESSGVVEPAQAPHRDGL